MFGNDGEAVNYGIFPLNKNHLFHRALQKHFCAQHNSDSLTDIERDRTRDLMSNIHQVDPYSKNYKKRLSSSNLYLFFIIPKVLTNTDIQKHKEHNSLIHIN